MRDTPNISASLIPNESSGSADEVGRTIRTWEIRDPQLPQYPMNNIVSSRYSLWSFIPKSMFEQFRRMANVYFLVLGTVAIIAKQTNYFPTSVEPAGLLLPMIVVVSISIVKDGWEDLKRHRTDAEIDAKLARQILRDGSLKEVAWKKITVGTPLLLLCDDEVPADVVVLSCGGVQGPTSYVETAAIDGETNLKIRNPAIPDKGVESASGQSRSVKNAGLLGNVSVRAEDPNASINVFNGSCRYAARDGQSSQVTLSEKNIILRGSVLRATEWAVCMAVYTGADTKLALNSKSPPSKVSSIDRVVNKTLIIAISFMVITCLLSMVFQVIWMDFNSDAYYLCLERDQLDKQLTNDGRACDTAAPNEFLSIFTFATLYNNFVCISMYVSLEVIYLLQAHFMASDPNMYDEETDTPCVVHNSSLTADLGQIEYVLSDKTGTLTKNNMCLKRLSIAGKVYGKPIVFPGASKAHVAEQAKEKYLPLSDLANLNPANAQSSSIGARFLRVLALCHTAMLMPDSTSGKLDVRDFNSLMECLQAESPDEVALVEAMCSHAMILLKDRTASTLTIRCTEKNGRKNVEEVYHILAVNEFESDRKRMSILLQKEGSSGSTLLCKGADTSMLPHCKKSKDTAACSEHIETFAKTGLRTLVMSERVLSGSETSAFMEKFNAASNSITNRSQMLSDCAIEIETSMTLLGAVGIEDELQDDMANSIDFIRKAGINMWMITGDKPATAKAIGQLSGLLTERHENTTRELVGLSGENLKNELIELNKWIQTLTRPAKHRGREEPDPGFCSTAGREFIALCNRFLKWLHIIEVFRPDEQHGGGSATADVALIVDGITLEGIWANTKLVRDFTAAAHQIPTVIASRVSPLQKATLVNMVKQAKSKPITLAIGDGANDVGMIHEARVGVGISGKEGRHASNAADFAISQFRFIVPLLIDHGRFNYVRAAKLVLYSFFKNLVLVSVLFYYSFYNGISGTIFVESLVLSGYNFYLGLPIIVIGAMDWDISKKEARDNPYAAYAQGRMREELNMFTFFRTCVLAFFEGLVIYAIGIRIIAGQSKVNSDSGPNPDDNYDIDDIGIHDAHGHGGGLYAEGYVLFSAIVVTMSMKVVSSGTFNAINLFVWLASLIGYFLWTYVYNLVSSVPAWYGVVSMAMATPTFWLSIILLPTIIMIIDIAVENFFSVTMPTSRDKLIASIDYDSKRTETIMADARSASTNSRTGQPSSFLSGSSSASPDRAPLTAGASRSSSADGESVAIASI